MQQNPMEDPMSEKAIRWYETSYRRNLVDMHIDDWNEEFFSRFDPQAYFECLKMAKIQSPMIYLQSHVGLCNWPSKSGRMHAGFKGVNQIGQLIDLCHSSGMDVVGYYSLIYNCWAYDAHPEWRMVDREEQNSRMTTFNGRKTGSRYGLVCPNNMEYRAFLFTQFDEFMGMYDVEGMRDPRLGSTSPYARDTLRVHIKNPHMRHWGRWSDLIRIHIARHAPSFP
jgi:hypothetical protein